MKNLSLALLASLCLTLPLALAAQQGKLSRVGDYTLDFLPDGSITAKGPTPSGKATLTLVGSSRPVSLVTQETGGAALEKSKLKSRRRELSSHQIVAQAKDYVKGKKPTVTGATLTGNVTILLEEVGLDGEKNTTKVRCDTAVFTAGPKLGTGRFDFSGNVHAWGLGGPGSGELTAKSGWFDLGDPDDAENKPRSFHLDAGGVTGNLKETEGKKK